MVYIPVCLRSVFRVDTISVSCVCDQCVIQIHKEVVFEQLKQTHKIWIEPKRREAAASAALIALLVCKRRIRIECTSR